MRKPLYICSEIKNAIGGNDFYLASVDLLDKGNFWLQNDIIPYLMNNFKDKLCI